MAPLLKSFALIAYPSLSDLFLTVPYPITTTSLSEVPEPDIEIFTELVWGIGTCWVAKPIEEKISSSTVEGTVNLKAPSLFVCVASRDPLAVTVTPERALPVESVTLPETTRSCAKVSCEKQHDRQNNRLKQFSP